MVDDAERRLQARQPFDGERRRHVVERGERRDDTGQDPLDELVEQHSERLALGAAHVAVAHRVGQRDRGVEQVADVGVGGRPAGEPTQRRFDAAGSCANSARSSTPMRSITPMERSARSTRWAVDADSSVVP